MYLYLPPSKLFLTYTDMFGDDILASPVVAPVDPKTNTTVQTIWLPPGAWVHFWTLEPYTGPMILNLTVGLPDLPLFVRAGNSSLYCGYAYDETGAIIPMKTMESATNYQPDPLLFVIFPGATDGNSTYYEDDGNSTLYQVFLPINAYVKLISHRTGSTHLQESVMRFRTLHTKW